MHNFTPAFHSDYIVRLADVSSIQEVFNTDAEFYGGSGKLNAHPEILRNNEGHAWGLKISVAPLATLIFKVIT